MYVCDVVLVYEYVLVFMRLPYMNSDKLKSSHCQDALRPKLKKKEQGNRSETTPRNRNKNNKAVRDEYDASLLHDDEDIDELSFPGLVILPEEEWIDQSTECLEWVNKVAEDTPENFLLRIKQLCQTIGVHVIKRHKVCLQNQINGLMLKFSFFHGFRGRTWMDPVGLLYVVSTQERSVTILNWLKFYAYLDGCFRNITIKIIKAREDAPPRR